MTTYSYNVINPMVMNTTIYTQHVPPMLEKENLGVYTLLSKTQYASSKFS